MPLPLTTKMGGTTLSFPDTCLTPSPSGPMPMPFPNLGMMMQVNPLTCPLTVYGVGYKAPITFLGRLATRQWLIPGYDRVFVTPFSCTHSWMLAEPSMWPASTHKARIPGAISIGWS